MFIELPVIWKESEDDEENTDLLSIDINDISAFNPTDNNEATTIRVYNREKSWVVQMTYEDFKEKFESIKGEIKSFIKTGIEI